MAASFSNFPEDLNSREAKVPSPCPWLAIDPTAISGALLKNEQDVHLFERLAFLSRREV
jgi:hypothetical protein